MRTIVLAIALTVSMTGNALAASDGTCEIAAVNPLSEISDLLNDADWPTGHVTIRVSEYRDTYDGSGFVRAERRWGQIDLQVDRGPDGRLRVDGVPVDDDGSFHIDHTSKFQTSDGKWHEIHETVTGTLDGWGGVCVSEFERTRKSWREGWNPYGGEPRRFEYESTVEKGTAGACDVIRS